jgi:hypothetical protein
MVQQTEQSGQGHRAARTGGTTGLGGGGRIERGEGAIHMGQSGLRPLGWPGKAALAVKGFSPGANENIEIIFYFVWILFKRFRFDF